MNLPSFSGLGVWPAANSRAGASRGGQRRPVATGEELAGRRGRWWRRQDMDGWRRSGVAGVREWELGFGDFH